MFSSWSGFQSPTLVRLFILVPANCWSSRPSYLFPARRAYRASHARAQATRASSVRPSLVDGFLSGSRAVLGGVAIKRSRISRGKTNVSYSRFSISLTTAPTTPIMEDSEEKKKKMKTGFEVAIPAPTSSLISNSDSYLLTRTTEHAVKQKKIEKNMRFYN